METGEITQALQHMLCSWSTLFGSANIISCSSYDSFPKPTWMALVISTAPAGCKNSSSNNSIDSPTS